MKIVRNVPDARYIGDVLDQIDHRRLLAEDPETVSAFLAGLEPLALGIARHRYRFRQDEAEDLLLEVLRKLWDSDKAALRAWRGQGSLKGYLAATVHRFCLMELRRRRRRPEETVPESLDIFATAGESAELERDQMMQLFREAETELPERDRQLIRMRFLEEREYPEIVSELGLTAGAARKAVHSALRRLRDRLRSRAPELFPAEPT